MLFSMASVSNVSVMSSVQCLKVVIGKSILSDVDDFSYCISVLGC